MDRITLKAYNIQISVQNAMIRRRLDAVWAKFLKLSV